MHARKLAYWNNNCISNGINHIQKGLTMKKIFLTTLLLPLFSFAEYEIKEGIEVKGKIASVKTSGKFASVEKCKNYATKRTGIVAFTFNSKIDKCTLFKSIRSMKKNENSTSGMIEEIT